MSIFSLKDKLAVVTGGATGIGFFISYYLAKHQANVVLVARREDKLQESVAKINNEFEGKARYIVADLGSESGITACSDRIKKEIGTPDIIFNCAGVNLRQPAEDISFDSWNTTIDINLKAPFFFTKAFSREMKQKANICKVVNIASLQSYRAFPNSIPYGASKGGIVQLTRAMAEAYAKDGINVNAIAPGFFNTELTAVLFQDSDKTAELSDKTAIGRNGESEDFEGITVFLASDASNYITGQTIALDGGFSIK